MSIGFYQHESKFKLGDSVKLVPPDGVIVGVTFSERYEEPLYDVKIESGQVMGGVPESDIFVEEAAPTIDVISSLPRGDISFAEQLAAGDPELAGSTQLERDLAFAGALEGQDALSRGSGSIGLIKK